MTSSRILQWCAAAVAVLLVLLLGVVAAGSAGFVVAALSLSAIGSGLARARLGSSPWVRPERRREDPPGWQEFHAFRDIQFALSWTVGRSDWFARTLLPRLVRAALAERRGIDLDRDPAAARDALGEEIWARVRPGEDLPPNDPASVLDLAQVSRIVESLEKL